MAKNGPNKSARGFMRETVEKLRAGETPRPISPFVEWLTEQARQGVRYNTIEEAQAAYNAATGE